jgi:Zn-dependent protease with chaperone function
MGSPGSERGGPASLEGPSSVTMFRAAVVLLAGWSIVATTGLVFVLVEGGVRAVEVVVRSPGTLFAREALALWALGAAGAFGVFLAAFVITQAVGRGLLRLLRPEPIPWPARLPRPSHGVRLLAFDSPRPEAFTFTLLVRGPGPLHGRRDEVILLSRGLLRALSPEEQEATIAHELGHVRELDGRYLTFLRTFACLLRWDPILALVASRLTRRGELQADADAVELTRRPRALARALYKVSRTPGGSPRLLASLLGPGGRRSRFQVEERIRRLISLAESGRFPEEPVG